MVQSLAVSRISVRFCLGFSGFSDEEEIQCPHDVVDSNDSLRHGLSAFKNDILPVHPVELIQRTAQTKRNLLERAYGSAFPMKMDIERQILSRFKVQRPPGLVPSSVLGLESLTNLDLEIS